MDAFEGCDYDLLDVMDLWGMVPADAAYDNAETADKGVEQADRDGAEIRTRDREMNVARA